MLTTSPLALTQWSWLAIAASAFALWGLSLCRKLGTWVLWLEGILHTTLTYLLFFSQTQMGFAQLRTLVILTFLFWGLLRVSRSWWIVAGVPLAVFTLARVLPQVEMADLAVHFGSQAPQFFAQTGFMAATPVLGLSYLVFRWLTSGIELREGDTALGSPAQFMLYTFFAPTFYIGPISSYALFCKSWQPGWIRSRAVIQKALARILWGATKFYAVSAIFYQLTFSRGLVLQEPAHWFLLLAALVAYPVYLYLNFSGFVDLVVGGSALLGVVIEENFDRPYWATSVRDFWRRWHMTLTRLLKAFVYLTFFKFLQRIVGPQPVRFAFIPATILVFVLMAYWHGSNWNFMVFGLLQAMALIAERLAAWALAQSSNPPTWLGNLALRLYVAAFLSISFFFFENSPEQIAKILKHFC